jgi:hypothetical protein
VDSLDCDGLCDFYTPPGESENEGIWNALDGGSVTAGDTILVWPGEYSGGLLLESGVVLISRHGPENTAIRGLATGVPAVRFLNGNEDTRVEGFTLDWDSNATGRGGGISANATGGTIENCIFLNCQSGLGGGVYAEFSEIRLINNVFVGNYAEDGGGAIAITACGPPFTANPVEIINNSFYQCEVPFGGAGAVFWAESSDFEFSNNIITGTLSSNAIQCGLSNEQSFTCNIFWDNPLGPYGGECIDFTGSYDNLNIDPLFCDAPGSDFGVCADSPALGGGCGTIGYVSPDGNCAACGGTALTPGSWGLVKSHYR